MSKYLELVATCQNYSNQMRDYKEDCCQFISAFLIGMSEYLNAPQDAIAVYPSINIKDVEEIRKTVTLRDNSPFCSLKFLIKVNHILPVVKDGTYVFDFDRNSVVVGTINVKKEDYENSYYVVKIDSISREFKVTDSQRREEVYEEIFKSITNFYKEGFENFLKGDKKSFGFQVESEITV